MRGFLFPKQSGYRGILKIMKPRPGLFHWLSRQKLPFRPGRKRKPFPVCLLMRILLTGRQKKSCGFALYQDSSDHAHALDRLCRRPECLSADMAVLPLPVHFYRAVQFDLRI